MAAVAGDSALAAAVGIEGEDEGGFGIGGWVVALRGAPGVDLRSRDEVAVLPGVADADGRSDFAHGTAEAFGLFDAEGLADVGCRRVRVDRRRFGGTVSQPRR